MSNLERAEDLSDLPQEILSQLKGSWKYSLIRDVNAEIVEQIRNAGGVASVDEILIGLYRQTRKIYKRNSVAARLYRMALKRVIERRPGSPPRYALSEKLL